MDLLKLSRKFWPEWPMKKSVYSRGPGRRRQKNLWLLPVPPAKDCISGWAGGGGECGCAPSHCKCWGWAWRQRRRNWSNLASRHLHKYCDLRNCISHEQIGSNCLIQAKKHLEQLRTPLFQRVHQSSWERGCRHQGKQLLRTGSTSSSWSARGAGIRNSTVWFQAVAISR